MLFFLVSVNLMAGLTSFMFYKKGVFIDDACSQDKLNHGVVAVGYGTENGVDYWLLKKYCINFNFSNIQFDNI